MKSPKWLKKKEIHSTAVTFPGIKLNTILPLSLWRFFHSQENKVVCKQYKMLLAHNLFLCSYSVELSHIHCNHIVPS